MLCMAQTIDIAGQTLSVHFDEEWSNYDRKMKSVAFLGDAPLGIKLGLYDGKWCGRTTNVHPDITKELFDGEFDGGGLSGGWKWVAKTISDTLTKLRQEQTKNLTLEERVERLEKYLYKRGS